jgi:hypothetical protein
LASPCRKGPGSKPISAILPSIHRLDLLAFRENTTLTDRAAIFRQLRIGNPRPGGGRNALSWKPGSLYGRVRENITSSRLFNK